MFKGLFKGHWLLQVPWTHAWTANLPKIAKTKFTRPFKDSELFYVPWSLMWTSFMPKIVRHYSRDLLRSLNCFICLEASLEWNLILPWILSWKYTFSKCWGLFYKSLFMHKPLKFICLALVWPIIFVQSVTVGY